MLDGFLLCIVILPQGRKIALQELHDTHPGCNKMNGLARNYIWWPKMDTAIEDIVKTCPLCQESRPLPTAAPIHPWEWPSQPWSRIHLDFAGHFLGSMYLLSVDAHLDIFPMQSISSTKTIEKLRILFANHGLPHKVVTDNGPSFTSAEFAEFMSKNGITHIKSVQYHPSTNGLAERAVQFSNRQSNELLVTQFKKEFQSFSSLIVSLHIRSLVLLLRNYLWDVVSDPDWTHGIQIFQRKYPISRNVKNGIMTLLFRYASLQLVIKYMPRTTLLLLHNGWLVLSLK